MFVFPRLQKTKSENYRVSYSSKENLADSNTPQVVRENPYENTLEFTSISFVSDSKIGKFFQASILRQKTNTI